jgi:hypothetical protein
MKFLCPFLMIYGALGMVQTAFALESGAPFQEKKTQRGGTRGPVGNRPPKQLDLGPQELQRKIDQLLRDELTGHWYPHAVDRLRGGFHQTMARDWSLRPDAHVSPSIPEPIAMNSLDMPATESSFWIKR